MFRATSSRTRRTAICLAAALVLSLPGAADAGLFDRAKDRAQNAVSNTRSLVHKVRENRPLASALGSAGEHLPGRKLIGIVQQLQLKQQLRSAVELIQQMNADFYDFSGGAFRCEGECNAFRTELADLFTDFVLLAEDVPVVGERTGIIQAVDRVLDRIDFMPPRALYLMWQALDGRMDQLKAVPGQIRTLLDSLPPLEDVSDIAVYANAAGSAVADSAVCAWVDQSEMLFVELVKAELDRLAWFIGIVADVIPGLPVGGQAGAEVGIAVANGTASASGEIDFADIVKMPLKIAKAIPEAINKAIDINILRAKLVCGWAEGVSG